MASVSPSSAMTRKRKPTLALYPPSLAQLAIEAHTQMHLHISTNEGFPASNTHSDTSGKIVTKSSKISNSFESKLREVEENEALKIFMMDYVWSVGPQIRGEVVAKARLMINGAYGIPGDMSPEETKLAIQWLIVTCVFTDGELDIKPTRPTTFESVTRPQEVDSGPTNTKPGLEDGGGVTRLRTSRSFSNVVRSENPVEEPGARATEAVGTSSKKNHHALMKPQPMEPPRAREHVPAVVGEHEAIIYQANKLLTDEQLRQILQRRQLERLARQSDSASIPETAVGSKADIEPEAQRDALHAWNDAWNWAQDARSEDNPGAGQSKQIEQCDPVADAGGSISSHVQPARNKKKWVKKREKRLRDWHARTDAPLVPLEPQPCLGDQHSLVAAIIDNMLQPRTQMLNGPVTATMEPSNQIDPRSYIGRTLGRLHQRNPDPDSSDLSSESTESSSEESLKETNSKSDSTPSSGHRRTRTKMSKERRHH
ncbi:hypothetical protein SERLA73DRAFT_80281 [Serpula lacrymans var. lacrymans S7.3]|uniref:DUF6532 domain-containing protein n=1 Tax=Serpula lacrymans var. lacrymans (strain S7.3) TaxID=936435 RepID=F8QJ99_SERL3|nr:hypothetical protein SERLA73DRAFT_80281 [Serpula lacrymans var. lacrymans S7.3]